MCSNTQCGVKLLSSLIKKVVFHGFLADLAGTVEVAAHTVADAIESISRTIPGLRPNPVTGRHRVMVVGCHTRDDFYLPWNDDVIHIFPQFNGGKSGGVTNIVIGTLLIVTAFVVAPFSPVLGTALFNFGVAMILSGVIAIIAPTPKADQSDSNASRYLGAPRNTVAIGTRIPILYGMFRVYGHYLSFEILAQDGDGT